MAMTVEEVLSCKKLSEVLTAKASATLEEIAKSLDKKNVGALLVQSDSGALVGIVTERDLVRHIAAGTDFAGTTVEQAMTCSVFSVEPQHDIRVAMEMMASGHLRHLPVMTGNKIVGIITVRDIIRALHAADKRALKDFVATFATA